MLKGKQRENLVSAMEVAIRSYIVSQKHRHGAQTYSFCDLTHCVHFKGGEKRKVHTPGLVLVSRKNKSITGFFIPAVVEDYRPSGMWEGAVDSYEPPDWDGERTGKPIALTAQMQTGNTRFTPKTRVRFLEQEIRSRM